jgi:mono/diheme cytochrome c family protein
VNLVARWSFVWFAMLTVVAIPGFAQDVAGDAARGKTAYQRNCTPCHGPGVHGRGLLPGTASLEVKYGGKVPAVLEERTNLSLAYLTAVIRRGSQGMPFFRQTELSNQDVRDIAAYLSRAAKNGDSPASAQPSSPPR